MYYEASKIEIYSDFDVYPTSLLCPSDIREQLPHVSIHFPRKKHPRRDSRQLNSNIVNSVIGVWGA
jgi:hypothetical protein